MTQQNQPGQKNSPNQQQGGERQPQGFGQMDSPSKNQSQQGGQATRKPSDTKTDQR